MSLSPTLCHKRPHLRREYARRIHNACVERPFDAVSKRKDSQLQLYTPYTKSHCLVVNKNIEIIVDHKTKRRETNETKTMAKSRTERRGKKYFRKSNCRRVIICTHRSRICARACRFEWGTAQEVSLRIQICSAIHEKLTIRCLSSIDRHYSRFIHSVGYAATTINSVMACMGLGMANQIGINIEFNIFNNDNFGIKCAVWLLGAKFSNPMIIYRGGESALSLFRWMKVKVRQTFCTFPWPTPTMSHSFRVSHLRISNSLHSMAVVVKAIE